MEKLVRSFKSLALKCVTINYFFNPLGRNPLNTYFILFCLCGLEVGGGVRGDKKGEIFIIEVIWDGNKCFMSDYVSIFFCARRC